MTTKPKILAVFAALALLIFGIILGRTTSPDHADPAAEQVHDDSDDPMNPTVWTCSMHPQIQSPTAGDCPICGMDLIPLTSDSGPGESTDPRTLKLSPSAAALAQIATTPVERRFPEAEIRLVGKLDYDETRLKNLTARFPARLDQLFVNYTGVAVEAGEHLARVYSPELLTAQQELLSAVKYDPGGPAAQAAREKLRLWDLSAEQIEDIIRSGAASDSFELRAPVGGVVVEKQVREGDYLQTGQQLFKIADLSQLWLQLEAYESDLPWLRLGQPVTFTVKSLPGEEFTGLIAFINPVLNEQTRTVEVRVVVPNEDGRLKPGMLADAIVTPQAAGGNTVYSPEMAGKFISPMHPWIIKDEPGQCDVCGMDLVPAEEMGYTDVEAGEAPLVVPAEAVLRTGKRAVVYVAVGDADDPRFEGREVVLGPRAGDVFLIKDGLEEGERVVTKGAFKIDSALQIQARPSMMMVPAGEEDATTAGEDAASPPAPLEIEPDVVRQVLPSYFSLQSALANDDLPAARVSMQAMMEITGHEGPLPDLLHKMLAAEDLDSLRRPHFEVLSETLIAALRSDPEAFPQNEEDPEAEPPAIYLMSCPMVYDTRGANWLQPTDDLRNPYFGAEMLTCGSLEETLTAKK